jgi:hypothetical protein
MFRGSSDWPNLAVVAFVRRGVLAISSRFVAVWGLRRNRWQTPGRAYFTWSGGFDFTCHRRGRDHGKQDPCGESQHFREQPSVFTLVRASRQGHTGVGFRTLGGCQKKATRPYATGFLSDKTHAVLEGASDFLGDGSEWGNVCARKRFGNRAVRDLSRAKLIPEAVAV